MRSGWSIESRRARAFTLSLFVAFCLSTGARTAHAQLQAAFREVAGGPVAPARIRVITENSEAWTLRWKLIESARSTIDTSYYIVGDDPFGRAFIGALAHKAQEGVRVRLLIDSRGSAFLTRSFAGLDVGQTMELVPGMQVTIYNPLSRSIFSNVSSRRRVFSSNHSKLLIIDGHTVLTGGRNVSRDYLASRQDLPRCFRDTDILIEGGQVPADARAFFDEAFSFRSRAVPPKTGLLRRALASLATRAEAAGVKSWSRRIPVFAAAYRTMAERLTGEDPGSPDVGTADMVRARAQLAPYSHLVPSASVETSGKWSGSVCLLGKRSLAAGGADEITGNLARLAGAAKRELIIQNPYVVLTPAGRTLLRDAARRGVQIVLLTNSATGSRGLDGALSQTAFQDDVSGLLSEVPGLKVYGALAPLHAKVFVLDGQVTIIGTYNLDALSEQVNAECVAVVDSPSFAEENRRRILADIAIAKPYAVRLGKDGRVHGVTGPGVARPPRLIKALDRFDLKKLAPVL